MTLMPDISHLQAVFTCPLMFYFIMLPACGLLPLAACSNAPPSLLLGLMVLMQEPGYALLQLTEHDMYCRRGESLQIPPRSATLQPYCLAQRERSGGLPSWQICWRG